ncbi:hypothetical protein BJY00DRAFT_300084 [Aspergillus carlsbadensis]|nr:hypothetical protein BJY00DRAFT_300084 [Aspergillus carlsbadensis]
MLLRASRLTSGSCLRLRVNNLRSRLYSSSSDNTDSIESILSKPTWSVRSLLPDPSTKTPPSVTPAQLRHLLRLSALPQPSSPEEEQQMLDTLESQIHFVKEIQKVDTTGVEPLQSIRDESPEAVKENTIGLERLREAMAKERVVGRNKKIQRVKGERNERPDGDAWDGNALGYAGKTKGSAFGSAPKQESKQDDQSLTTILNRSQRADLTVLIAQIAQRMRDLAEETFKTPDPRKPKSASDNLIDLDDDDGGWDWDSDKDEKAKKAKADRARTEYVPTSEDAKEEAALLTQFDDWRDSVLLRVGEVVNKDADDDEGDSLQGAQPESPHEDDDGDRTWKRLSKVYPPVETPLINLPKPKRLLILHSLLLLLLSLEHYNARSRVLMLFTASSLGIGIKTLNQDEVKVARGLLDAALQLSAGGDAQSPSREDPSRKWKVGIASVAGAVLIGVTGGLAAPFIAAGLGTVMGGLGLGATAAAGYLGALAGSGVIVGGLFGAYGGKMTGRMVDKYAREVDDFAFLPIHGSQKRTENERDAARDDHRLRVTIGVSGWLTEESNFHIPWRVIGSDSEVFGLRWETEALMELGNAMDYLVTTAAWTAGGQVLSKTILGGLLSAMILPLGLLKVARIADNPFSVAKARADKAGEVLADALISKVQGERTVTLIGYSLGSRVIYSCLQSLAKRQAYGLVDSAVLMGSPTPSDAPDWRRLRRVVNGRLINVYSENDSVLAFLYRTSSLQYGVAGLQPIENVPGVENLDVSDIISGHLRYQFLLGRILRTLALESINSRELAREEAALAAKDKKQEQQRIQNERKAGIEGDKEAARKKLESGEIAEEEERRIQEAEENRPRLPRRPARVPTGKKQTQPSVKTTQDATELPPWHKFDSSDMAEGREQTQPSVKTTQDAAELPPWHKFESSNHAEAKEQTWSGIKVAEESAELPPWHRFESSDTAEGEERKIHPVENRYRLPRRPVPAPASAEQSDEEPSFGIKMIDNDA